MGTKWSQEEIRILREKYPKMGKGVLDYLNRPWGSVRGKAHKLGLKSKKRYSKEEDEIIKEHYKSLGGRVSWMLLGRDKRSVVSRANRLGLEYSPQCKVCGKENTEHPSYNICDDCFVCLNPGCENNDFGYFGYCRSCSDKLISRPVVVCEKCGMEKEHQGKGMCESCYWEYYYSQNSEKLKKNYRDWYKENIGLRGHDHKGENNPNSVLSEDDVLNIKLLVLGGRKHREIADMFNVSRKHVGAIVRGESWSHLTKKE